jgi:chemotaxis family two-component system response regulator Rcp1
MINYLGKPIKILMVEDNEGDVILTREALFDANIRNEMMVINNGEKAVDFLKTTNLNNTEDLPGLIFMDINLPRINGHEVIKFIKSDERLCHIPVFVLTSSTAPNDIEKSEINLVTTYLVKPINIPKFIQSIQTLEGYSI